MRDVVLPEGKICDHDMKLFHVTDSPAEVVEIVKQSQKLADSELR